MHEQLKLYVDREGKEAEQRQQWHEQNQEPQPRGPADSAGRRRAELAGDIDDSAAQLMDQQYQVNEILQKQEKDFKNQLQSKQYIIDESNRQIMNQATQIDSMQNLIQQLQSERHEQRARVDEIAARNRLAVEEGPPRHVLPGYDQQAELNRRSQSLQKSNNKLTAINREIEISKFQLEAQSALPASVIVAPLRGHPDEVNGVLVI